MSGDLEKTRYVLLDVFRGFCLLNMVCYHALYDIVYIKEIPISWFSDTPGYLWQQCICWSFIYLSGMCSRISRRRVPRGLLLLACGWVVTAATELATPQEAVHYGVLTLLGLCPLLLELFSTLFERLCWKIPDLAGLLVCALLFFLLRGVPQGYLGFEGLRLLELPDTLYRWDFAAVLGFPSPAFSSSDYFPLIPWFFLYLAGYFFWGMLVRSERALAFLRGPNRPAAFSLCRPLAFLGRHSLVVYLLHQPVLMGIFLLL